LEIDFSPTPKGGVAGVITFQWRLATCSLLAVVLGSVPFGAIQAQKGAGNMVSEYLKATWYALFTLDPEGSISSAPRICVDSHGLAFGEPDPRDLTTLADRDTTTVPFLESIGQYVVDASDCWSAAPDTTYPTLYVQGSITRRRAGNGDSVSVALFQLFRARPCATSVAPRCALPAKGAPTIYVTGLVAKTASGWPPIPLRRTFPDF
jgi:hypothetical protein